MRTAFENACKRALLDGVTLHTLRHTFASRLAMAGVDLRTIQELGGWSDLNMVQRNSHLSPSHKAEAVERIAQNSPTVFTTPALSGVAAGGGGIALVRVIIWCRRGDLNPHGLTPT